MTSCIIVFILSSTFGSNKTYIFLYYSLPSKFFVSKYNIPQTDHFKYILQCKPILYVTLTGFHFIKVQNNLQFDSVSSLLNTILFFYNSLLRKPDCFHIALHGFMSQAKAMMADGSYGESTDTCPAGNQLSSRLGPIYSRNSINIFY